MSLSSFNVLSDKINPDFRYHQNPAIKLTTDEAGRPSTTNVHAAPRLLTQTLSADAPAVPDAAVPEALPEVELDRTVRHVVAKLREFLEERPIMTRRYIMNKLSRKYEYHLKFAIQYVGYVFRSGPWRETIIKYGVDPRMDPKYRCYQTMMFKLSGKQKASEPVEWEDQRGIYRRATAGKEQDLESHLFDGTKVVQDGRIWQVCDITDPTLRKMLDTPKLRTECEVRHVVNSKKFHKFSLTGSAQSKVDGWYPNATWAAIRVIMRNKIRTIVSGRIPDPVECLRLAEHPEVIDSTTRHVLPFGSLHGTNKPGSQREILLSNESRNVAKAHDHELLGVGKAHKAGQASAEGDIINEECSETEVNGAYEDSLDHDDISLA